MNDRALPRLQNDRIFSAYPSVPPKAAPALSIQLLHQQQTAWPQLRDGYSALSDVRVREVHCDGYSVQVQLNPRRSVSTGAGVDPLSISQRACFLCPVNLTPEQKGVLYRGEFLVLCNPVPIFDRHLTIAHVDHIPQAMEESIATFLGLAREMSPEFTVFYNGPKCGASAPDHLHFQACPAGTIPIEKEAGIPTRRQLLKASGPVSFFVLRTIGRQVIVLESHDATGLEVSLMQLMSAMREILQTAEEPMVNVICSHMEGMWRVILFPRRKHRPGVFFKEGDERVLISPAAVDIGGLIVTPMEKDFNRVDATMVQAIYDEVLLDEDTVHRILGAM